MSFARSERRWRLRADASFYRMAFEFRDGRIRAVREYLDTALVGNALL